MNVRSRNIFLACFAVISFMAFACEKVAAQPEGSGAIMAIEEKPSSGGGRAPITTAEGQGKTMTSSRSSALPAKTAAKATTRTRQPAPSRPANVDSNGRYLGPVLGDTYTFLNFEVVDKVQPVWTIAAKNAGAIGLVQVAVLIGENGEVLQAKGRSGNSLLYPEAEKAALASRLNKPTANGRPARALGFLVYRFGTEEQEYEQEQKSKRPNQPR